MTYIAYREDLEKPAPDETDVVGKIVEALHRNNVWAYNKY